MYICICNALRDRDVRRVIREGEAGTVAGVYKAFDTTPCCGKCGPCIRDILSEESNTIIAASAE